MLYVFRTLRFTSFLLALALSCGSLQATGPADRSNSPPNTLDDSALVRALRDGGHVLYFRHGKTDLSTLDSDRGNLGNCATQRRLSKEGRSEMAEIGQVLRELGIRVSSVRSSPYCRALETAELAFGRADIDNDLTHTVMADEATARRQSTALKRLLATVPERGTNGVLAGHTGNLQESTGIWPSPEGVAIVFRPDGNGEFSYVATVPPGHWKLLLQRDKSTEATQGRAK